MHHQASSQKRGVRAYPKLAAKILMDGTQVQHLHLFEGGDIEAHLGPQTLLALKQHELLSEPYVLAISTRTADESFRIFQHASEPVTSARASAPVPSKGGTFGLPLDGSQGALQK